MNESIFIKSVANGYLARRTVDYGAKPEEHVFETFDGLVAHLRRELPNVETPTPPYVRCDFDCAECAKKSASEARYAPGGVYTPPPKPVTATQFNGGINEPFVRSVGILNKLGAEHDPEFCDICRSKCPYPTNFDGSPKTIF